MRGPVATSLGRPPRKDMITALSIALARTESGHYTTTVQSPFSNPAIDELEKAFGLHAEPWCAMSACMCGAIAYAQGGGEKWPWTAGSQEVLEWFRCRGAAFSDLQTALKMKGALLIRTDENDPSRGHAAMVQHRYTHWATGEIVAFGTVEADVPIPGQPGKWGMAQDWRPVAELEKEIWHVCDTSGLAGGEWWK